VRTWHKNGVLASEEPYQGGLLHGLCRQWDEAGRLLGKYRMVHGTGIQRAWHDNGQLQIEVSTVRGEFCGRNRIWLRDGTLLSERFYVHGRVVTAEEYRRAAAKDRRLPRLRAKPAKLPARNGPVQKRIHRNFVAWLLQKPNHLEALRWLRKKTNDDTARALGRFKRESDALRFVKGLYHAGGREVVVPDIYSNSAGDQFSDCLLVRLPADVVRREAVRAACTQLRTRRLGAVEPDKDIGETHLYLSMS